MEGVSMATNVTELEIYTNYTLFVRARTVALGNESERVTVATEEDRKFVNSRQRNKGKCHYPALVPSHP